jgi:hypothetical protein
MLSDVRGRAKRFTGHIFPIAAAARTSTRTSRRETVRSPARSRSLGDGRAPIYTAVNADAALEELERFDDQWGARYPMIAESWRKHWEHIIPFLALPAELRKAVYTTNSIENLNRQIRKSIKTRPRQLSTGLVKVGMHGGQLDPSQTSPSSGSVAGRSVTCTATAPPTSPSRRRSGPTSSRRRRARPSRPRQLKLGRAR